MAGRAQIYLATYTEAVHSQIYVDKTGLIAYTNSVLNTAQKYICVSRPRRFGKFMAADMLVAYYSCGCDSRSLFRGRNAEKAHSFLSHLNHHQVIRLDIQRFLETEDDLDTFISEIEQGVIRELLETFPEYAGLLSGARLKVVLSLTRRLPRNF